MKKHQNHRYFTAVCIASAIFAVLLCLALFLIVTGDRSELELSLIHIWAEPRGQS